MRLGRVVSRGSLGAWCPVCSGMIGRGAKVPLHRDPKEVLVRSRSRAAIVIWALTGVVVVLGAFIGASTLFQPGCVACHMRGDFEDATLQAAHPSVACTDCHGGGSSIPSRVAFGAKQVFGMYVPLVSLDPTTAWVQSSRCLSCHAAEIKSTVDARGLRLSHSACGVGRECTDCHSTVGHGALESWPRAVTMEMCFECHGAGGAPSECDLCHTTRRPSDRVASGTFAVTHGKDWLKTHGMGGADTCSPCHDSSKCAGCHGTGVPHVKDFVNKHSAPASDAGAQCEGCHTETFCTACHGVEMPHPVQFLMKHAEASEPDDGASCLRCHDPVDCTECHERHVHPVTIEQLRELGLDIPAGSAQ